ncbi:MAG: hypothetical protein JWP16_749, partial [Alphaproteobacteria bacterium]|nr:hypothetical protein [Alphaproteobacteria bacterium]
MIKHTAFALLLLTVPVLAQANAGGDTAGSSANTTAR